MQRSMTEINISGVLNSNMSNNNKKALRNSRSFGGEVPKYKGRASKLSKFFGISQGTYDA
jgi:hypothetical protein